MEENKDIKVTFQLHSVYVVSYKKINSKVSYEEIEVVWVWRYGVVWYDLIIHYQAVVIDPL